VRGLALHLEAGARLGTRPLLKLLIPGDSDLEGEQQEACQRDLTPAGSSRGRQIRGEWLDRVDFPAQRLSLLRTSHERQIPAGYALVNPYPRSGPRLKTFDRARKQPTYGLSFSATVP